MKTWSVQFAPAKGRGPWMCFTVEAATKAEAKAIGLRLIGIEGGSWTCKAIIEQAGES